MKNYRKIVSHYESCLEKHGDTHLGVDWPHKEDVETRYQVMLEVVKPNTHENFKLLDFGCGTSHLYEYILQNQFENIIYSGLDLSKKFIELSRRKFPDIDYYCMDILDDEVDLPIFDYIVMNGVFTEKLNLSFEEMFTFFQTVVNRVYNKAEVGIAFNLMSKQVDWEREDLFHVSLDFLADFLTKKISRHFVIRNDYGLYEYTTYVYK